MTNTRSLETFTVKYGRKEFDVPVVTAAPDGHSFESAADENGLLVVQHGIGASAVGASGPINKHVADRTGLAVMSHGPAIGRLLGVQDAFLHAIPAMTELEQRFNEFVDQRGLSPEQLSVLVYSLGGMAYACTADEWEERAGKRYAISPIGLSAHGMELGLTHDAIQFADYENPPEDKFVIDRDATLPLATRAQLVPEMDKQWLMAGMKAAKNFGFHNAVAEARAALANKDLRMSAATAAWVSNEMGHALPRIVPVFSLLECTNIAPEISGVDGFVFGTDDRVVDAQEATSSIVLAQGDTRRVTKLSAGHPHLATVAGGRLLDDSLEAFGLASEAA